MSSAKRGQVSEHTYRKHYVVHHWPLELLIVYECEYVHRRVTLHNNTVPGTELRPGAALWNRFPSMAQVIPVRLVRHNCLRGQETRRAGLTATNTSKILVLSVIRAISAERLKTITPVNWTAWAEAKYGCQASPPCGAPHSNMSPAAWQGRIVAENVTLSSPMAVTEVAVLCLHARPSTWTRSPHGPTIIARILIYLERAIWLFQKLDPGGRERGYFRDISLLHIWPHVMI